MDEPKCPVCGGVNFKPCGKVRDSDGNEADGLRCLCCCYVFCEFDLALATKTRARQIAEAVKPWRDVVETLTEARRERCMEICQPADADFDCCVICTNRPCLAACALLASEAGKTGGRNEL
jgi:hypothetical protein